MVSPKPLLKAIRPLACVLLLLPGVAMAGGYPSRSGENNLIGDPASAQAVASGWHYAGLRKVLGLSRMSFHAVNSPIAITDLPLEADAQSATGHDVVVDNFSFSPVAASVPVGATVRWTNRDDVPHVIMSTEKKFKSPVMDTDEQFSHTFEAPGSYDYFCSLHPKMTGRVTVG